MSLSGEQKRARILAVLTDGQFHSGEVLGAQLGVSRVAIAKHIKALSELGLDIFSVSGKGYKLGRSVELLNADKIAALRHSNGGLDVLNVVGSTNDVIKSQLSNLHSGHVCLAEAQTAGRGRQGKVWVSPFGSSVYLSMYWAFSGGYHSINGLSLVVGLAVAATLNKLGLNDSQIKWPNDIYYYDQKLAGVLIELEGQVGAQCHAIIGIGLNMDLAEVDANIDQPWTDLKSINGSVPERNQLCAMLIDELHAYLQRFEQQGFEQFIPQWQQHDWLVERELNLHCGNNIISGVGKGVDVQGALLMQTAKGIERFFGGEISVRAK
ncbi:bifunctional biotin--[acetyl-CoA-carboxylase] ligase/biotin operon repressor BirA [Alteromonadaceae bacterium BrNp21-10]|nr:bifunctional biotin--[acetyl-CoA-carboxylase] ligase/biotin operon repressor BirA [Alteromonadaceae bacterium BrNp21-10]